MNARMENHALATGNIPATVNVSRFRGAGGVDEFHFIVRPTAPGRIEDQLDAVERAYRQALEQMGLKGPTARLRRFFCSDLPNQTAALEAQPFANPQQPGDSCAVSWIG